MKRRAFISLLCGAAAWPLAARAQRPAKMLRVGTVAGTPKSSPQWVAFERRMGELGYQEGKNFSFDFLQAASADEYEVLYRKLVANAPDVILAIGPEIGLKSARAATRTLPIVMIAIDYDPLARGYVTSLARPSGNVTGVVFQQIELAAKRIQLIKDSFSDRPAATMFWDQLSADQWEAARSTAAMLGLQLFGIELNESPYDYEAALRKAPLDHRGLLIVPTSPSFFRDRARLADFALQHRLLSMFVFREWVDAGGLLCYGPSITALFARVAEFVDRIARGTMPSDLPIGPTTCPRAARACVCARVRASWGLSGWRGNVNRIELWFSHEPDLDLLADAQRFDALPLGYSTAPDEHRQRRKLSGNVRRDRLRPHDARTRAHARARERPQIETIRRRSLR